MYKKDRAKAAALYICGGLAIGSCIALIIFFIHTLKLRTEYRAVCLEINDAILASRIEDDLIIRGDESAPLTQKTADYYDAFLLDSNTAVFNRKVREVNDKSIQLCFNGSILSFTGYGDGSEIHIR